MFRHREWEQGAIFVTVSGSYFCKLSEADVKSKLSRVLNVDLVQIPESSEIIGHGYVPHAEYSWTGMYCLRYRPYLFPNSVPLKHSMAFAYSASLGCMNA